MAFDDESREEAGCEGESRHRGWWRKGRRSGGFGDQRGGGSERGRRLLELVAREPELAVEPPVREPGAVDEGPSEITKPSPHADRPEAGMIEAVDGGRDSEQTVQGEIGAGAAGDAVEIGADSSPGLCPSRVVDESASAGSGERELAAGRAFLPASGIRGAGTLESMISPGDVPRSVVGTWVGAPFEGVDEDEWVRLAPGEAIERSYVIVAPREGGLVEEIRCGLPDGTRHIALEAEIRDGAAALHAGQVAEGVRSRLCCGRMMVRPGTRLSLTLRLHLRRAGGYRLEGALRPVDPDRLDTGLSGAAEFSDPAIGEKLVIQPICQATGSAATAV